MSKNLTIARECGMTGPWTSDFYKHTLVFSPSELDAFAERIRAEKAIDAPEPSDEHRRMALELRMSANLLEDGQGDDWKGELIADLRRAADLLAANQTAPQAREPSGEHLSDALSKSMRVLEAVDVYHERPDRMNRTALRTVIMDEFEAALLAARSAP